MYGTWTDPITTSGISFDPDSIETGPICAPREGDGRAEKSAEEQRRERPDQVQKTADERVGAAAEIAGGKGERNREKQR